jgi:hypothetical protein
MAAMALLWGALDLDRAVEVEVGNDARAHCLLHGEELRKGNLLAFGIGDVDRREFLRCGATDIVSLHIDPTHLAFLEGVVHIGATEVDAERRHG